MEHTHEVPEISVSDSPSSLKDIANFKVIFNKKKYDICFDLDSKISQLKEHLHTIIGKLSDIFIYKQNIHNTTLYEFRCP